MKSNLFEIRGKVAMVYVDGHVLVVDGGWMGR